MERARSELEVLKITYQVGTRLDVPCALFVPQLKIDQMGFGFAGQAQNTELGNAVLGKTEGDAMNNTVHPILENELLRRKIEVATLVHHNGTVVASASAHPPGAILDPHGLVWTISWGE